jgi:hypothetical protein
LRVPEAIVNVENVTPVTMEEVVSRLTAALVKVVVVSVAEKARRERVRYRSRRRA